jgi:hypothetical protein
MTCGLLAALQLMWVEPLRFVRLYTGAYLASFVLLAGLMLLWVVMRAAGVNGAVAALPAFHRRAAGCALLLGLALMLALGAWLAWTIFDATLAGPKWWRFAVLAVAGFPYLLAEELAMGAPGEAGGNPGATQSKPFAAGGRRLMVFLARRAALWLALVAGVLFLGSGQILTVLLVQFFAGYSLLMRFTADVMWRRTGSPVAAALVNAILAGWLLALFPLS